MQVGYLHKDDGIQIAVDFDGPNERLLSSTRNDISLRGMWTECALPIVLTHKQDFVVSVGHLFPLKTRARQSYRLVDAPAAAREWDPDMRWWEVNTAWTYQLSGLSAGIVGFRWAHLVVEFERASKQQGFAFADDAAKLNANAYIPFVGLLWESRSPRLGS